MLREVLIKEMEPNDSAIEAILKTCDSWDFDLFELQRATMGRPLYYLGMYLFNKYGFREAYQIDDVVLRNFLRRLEDGYKPNAYHNSTHAADVMHAMHYFITVLGLNELITPDDCFSGMVAAAIHDYEHLGQSNAFLISSYDTLAIRYNDLAVLEHFHCARAFELILEKGNSCNILLKLSRDKFKSVRTSILSMVLATDLASHFEYIGKFKNKTSGAGLDFNDPKDRQLIMDIATKCSDISNGAKSAPISRKWTELIMEEFWLQGDEERKRNMPVSMFMDRNVPGVAKCQVGFIDYIVAPLFEVWDSYLDEDNVFPAVKNLAANREYWKAKIQEENDQLRSRTGA